MDGGALLHHVHWPTSITFGDLLSHYVTTVRKEYGNCHVVFDGYQRPNVKDQEHARRAVQRKCNNIQFTNDMRVSSRKEDFLSNTNNKTLFIQKLRHLLLMDGQEVTVSDGDADMHIVCVAIEVSNLYLKIPFYTVEFFRCLCVM